MRLFYHDHFVLPLPDGHRFPMSKYRLLRERVVADGLVSPDKLQEGPAVTDEQILRVHSADYLNKLKHGTLSAKEIRRIGFPWSPQLLERSRRSAGSTLAACRTALAGELGANLAGGTHHAHRDWGQGYCVLNDAVIAARTLQAERLVERVAIVDLDVHQGNGSAALTEGDPTIFTFSMHGAKNFPFHKAHSDLDIGLLDGAEDDEYLTLLDEGLWRVFAQAKPELVIYLAGADPFTGDRLGRLCLSKGGLRQRDERVLHACAEHDTPVALAMAGGYAKQVADIVDIHFGTLAAATQLELG